MGTSSSNPGPKGKRNPNPPWPEGAQENSNFPKPIQKEELPKPVTPKEVPKLVELPLPPKSWASPKRKIVDFSKESTQENFGKLGKGYVKASGGKKSAASSARAGRQSIAKVTSFFAFGLSSGFENAAKQIGINTLVGKDADAIASEIIDACAPTGGTIEEAAARNAMIETMKEFFKEIDFEANGIEAFENLDEPKMRLLVELSIANYINERLQIELINRVERKATTIKRANKISKQIKKFIKGAIKIDFKDIKIKEVDWKGVEGKRIMTSLFEQGYAIIGDE